MSAAGARSARVATVPKPRHPRPNRTATPKRRATDHITSITLEELRRLDARSYFGEQFAGERIPAPLSADRAMQLGTGMNIERKPPQHSPGIERALAAMLANESTLQRLIPEGELVVNSFNVPAPRACAASAGV